MLAFSMLTPEKLTFSSRAPARLTSVKLAPPRLTPSNRAPLSETCRNSLPSILRFSKCSIPASFGRDSDRARACSNRRLTDARGAWTTRTRFERETRRGDGQDASGGGFGVRRGGGDRDPGVG